MEYTTHMSIKKLYEIINKQAAVEAVDEGRESLLDLERYVINLELENNELKQELSLVTENGYLYK